MNMDDLDLLASNKTNETDDFVGESNSDEISEQLLQEQPTTNETYSKTEFEELDQVQKSNDDDDDVTTKTDEWNQEQTESFPSTNDVQENDEKMIDTSDNFVETFPPTSEEIFNSSSSFGSEGPRMDERMARVQAINQRIAEELAAREEAEARRKADLLQQAKQDLQRWYEQRERQMNEKRQQMKSEEDTLRTISLEKSDKNKCDWAKVIRLLEFGPGSSISKSKRDLSRMKASIINAKRQGDANNSSS